MLISPKLVRLLISKVFLGLRVKWCREALTLRVIGVIDEGNNAIKITTKALHGFAQVAWLRIAVYPLVQ